VEEGGAQEEEEKEEGHGTGRNGEGRSSLRTSAPKGEGARGNLGAGVAQGGSRVPGSPGVP
jgi:hypothetical protein